MPLRCHQQTAPLNASGVHYLITLDAAMKPQITKNLQVTLFNSIYVFLFYLILPLLPLWLRLKARKNPAYLQKTAERFGHFNFPQLERSIWIHAVSLGESNAAIPLIEELLSKYPKTPIVVTSMTPPGMAQMQKTFGNRVLQLYAPYDYPQAVKRFLDHIKPKILIIMETELWPNILEQCQNRAISTLIVNARLSQRSFSRYKYLGGFIKYVLNCATFVIAQNKAYGLRFTKLGLNRSRLLVMGNMKFDLKLPENLSEQALALRKQLGCNRPIWVAASTHAEEEEKILLATTIINESIPNALLILIPRHPERFTQVANLAKNQGFKTIRYSDSLSNYDSSTNVIIGDTMGQLLLFYAIANVAFVGGSLVPKGGHNILEPALLEKPVITGLYLEHFAEIAQLFLDNDALITVNDEMALAQRVIELLQDKQLRQQYGIAHELLLIKTKEQRRRF